MQTTRALDQQSNNCSVVQYSDKKIIEVVKELIRQTAIPGPGDKRFNDMYKILVNKFKTSFHEAKTDPMSHSRNDYDGFCQEYESVSNDESDSRNIKLYNFSTHVTTPYWQAPGQVVELRDPEGSKIFVKGLREGDKKKTLVKKVKNTTKGNEVSSWIVELADSEQAKSVEEDLSITSGLISESTSMLLRSPETVDEWKTIADMKREEAAAWKKRFGFHEEPSSTQPSASSRFPVYQPNTGNTYPSCSSQNFKQMSHIGITGSVLWRNNRFPTELSHRSKVYRNSKGIIIKKPSTTYPNMSRMKRSGQKLRKKKYHHQRLFARDDMDSSGFAIPSRPHSRH